MNLQLTDRWKIESDGLQFIVTFRERRILAKKVGRFEAGHESEREQRRYFYSFQTALSYMAEQELRLPQSLHKVVKRLDELQRAIDRLPPIIPSPKETPDGRAAHSRKGRA